MNIKVLLTRDQSQSQKWEKLNTVKNGSGSDKLPCVWIAEVQPCLVKMFVKQKEDKTWTYMETNTNLPHILLWQKTANRCGNWGCKVVDFTMSFRWCLEINKLQFDAIVFLCQMYLVVEYKGPDDTKYKSKWRQAHCNTCQFLESKRQIDRSRVLEGE